MSENLTENTEPTVKRADALQTGDHVIEIAEYGKPPQPMKVLFAHPFRDGDGKPMVALMLDALTKIGGFSPLDLRVSADTKFEMADEQDLAAFRDAGRRHALAAALHQLADDIVRLELPVTARLFDAAPGVLRSRADLERWAAYLGTEIKMSGRTPIVSAGRPVVDGLDLHFHTQIAPEPEPEGLESMSDLAAGMAAADEAGTLDGPRQHYHAAGAGGEAGACAAVCACGVTFAGFDSIAEAVVELDKHIANPEPDEAEQEWLFTFGAGQEFDGRFVRIFGTFEDAQERMCRVFGTAWCDQYDWRRFDQLGLPALLTELPEAGWPNVDHQHVAGTAGGPGDNSAVCACGMTFEGFDTHAEAVKMLNRHIVLATTGAEPAEA